MQEKMHECLVQLIKISPNGKFNYSIEETMKLELSNWVSFEEFVSISNSNLFVSSLFGDIYFKSI